MLSLSNGFSKSYLNVDALTLLRYLMYLPGGNVKIKNIKSSRHMDFYNDPRIILSYCYQKSYIELYDSYIQLTEYGLSYYLKFQSSKLIC